MAKRSAKKYAYYDKQKETTNGTVFIILKKLTGVDEKTLLNSLFFTTDDVVIRKLVNKVEYILSDAVVNPARFATSLHPALQKLSKEILDNKWVPKFIELTHIMYERTNKNCPICIAEAYYSLIIQLATYLTQPGDVLVGVDREGNPLGIPEKYPDIDKLVYMVSKEFEKKSYANYDDFCVAVAKKLRDSGYPNVRNYDDIQYMFLDEQLTTDVLFAMMPFVKSLDSEILDFPYVPPKIGNFVLPNRTDVIDDVKEALQNRRRLLPKEGVYIEQIGGAVGVEKLWMSEVLYCDRLYMVYNLKVNGNSLVGYYNTSNDFFYSVFHDAQSEQKVNNVMFKSLLLEVYANLTSDIDTGMELFVSDNDKHSTHGKRGTHRLDKSKLKEVSVDVDFYIRKLPVDATASPDAIALAKKYGIKLGVGETFVRPFTRKAYNRTSEK